MFLPVEAWHKRRSFLWWQPREGECNSRSLGHWDRHHESAEESTLRSDRRSMHCATQSRIKSIYNFILKWPTWHICQIYFVFRKFDAILLRRSVWKVFILCSTDNWKVWLYKSVLISVRYFYKIKLTTANDFLST